MKHLLLRFPTPKELAVVNSYYEKKLREFKEAKIITKAGLAYQLNKHGIFTFEQEREIARIENLSKIKYQKPFKDMTEEDIHKEINNTVIEIMVGERTVDLVEHLTVKEEKENLVDPDIKRYGELCTIRDRAFKYCIESLAERERTLRLAQFCCYNADTEKRVWETWERFQGEKNNHFQMLVINLCSSFLSGVRQSVLRRIARHPIWRSKWISATKTGSQLFTGTISEWDQNKTFLCYWSNFYDNIYSAYEPPDDFIVEDDELLDRWLEQKAKDSKNPAKPQADGSSNGDVGYFRNRVNPLPKKK